METAPPFLFGRLLNARAHELAGRSAGPRPYFCECGSPGCYAPVWLDELAYERIVRSAGSILAPGHGSAPSRAA